MVSAESRREKAILRGCALLIVLACGTVWVAGCTSYRDPRAEVSVTSNQPGAAVYLVPINDPLPKPLTTAAMKPYYAGKTSDRGGVWIHHGYYWIVLEKGGQWSDPVEFEVRLDYLNKVHVDF